MDDAIIGNDDENECEIKDILKDNEIYCSKNDNVNVEIKFKHKKNISKN